MTDITRVLVIREYLKEQLRANERELNGYSDGFSYAVMIEGDKSTLNHFTNEHRAVEVAQVYWQNASIYTNNPEFIEADIEGSIYYTEHMDDLTLMHTPDDCIRVYDGSASKEYYAGINTQKTGLNEDMQDNDYYKKQAEAHDLEEEIGMLNLYIGQRDASTPSAIVLTRTRNRLKDILKAIVVFIVICVMMGCSDSEEEEFYDQHSPVEAEQIHEFKDTVLRRIKILEQNVISYVKLSPEEQDIFRYLDTIWVDLASHTINDTAKQAEICVILLNNAALHQ